MLGSFSSLLLWAEKKYLRAAGRSEGELGVEQKVMMSEEMRAEHFGSSAGPRDGLWLLRSYKDWLTRTQNHSWHLQYCIKAQVTRYCTEFMGKNILVFLWRTQWWQTQLWKVSKVETLAIPLEFPCIGWSSSRKGRWLPHKICGQQLKW